MDSSLYKTIITSGGNAYSYYASPSLPSPKGTILLLHGFPETSSMWSDFIAPLTALSYNLLVPSLLGYAPTSAPLSPTLYNSRALSSDLISILDAEHVHAAIVIGHDWGSFLAGRFANWHPDRISGLILTSVAYRPSAKLDLAASNVAMKNAFGYEPLGYWEWIAGEEASFVIEAHLESFFSLLFAKDTEVWKTDFTPAGKLQKWLAEDKMVPQADFVDENMKKETLAKWKEDGFAAKLCWYKAMTENIHWEQEQHLPASAFKLSMPVLFIGGSRDAPAPSILGELATKPLCEDYTGVVIDSGHWMLREKPDEWLDIVSKWLLSKF